ncbi:cupin domain-containing protein [Natronosalvus caseinilyticus]|uniref:cupin domain-containing protein n=1 Tax=Natronosalvus caseinilyticus TaxID=2953747 RepID=UPI0028A77B64|nr:cupin domain-containing protein [Natronosalvus caseinilyticus]
MGYRIVDPGAVDPAPDRPSECRKLSETGGLETMAINRFRAEPGEELPLAYHYHETQQEAFYVLEGTMAVETPEETYEVPADCLFVVDPGSPQRAYNPTDAEGPITVLAIGAPATDGDAHAYDPDDESDV